jgi:broad specificity phosphatase PhoE
MHLIVFRHGQTEYNRTRRFQGQMDVPLNDVGREQATRTAAIVANLLKQKKSSDKHLVCFTSDLSRASQTAQACAEELAGVGLASSPFVNDTRLREWDCGNFQGLTADEFATQNPEEAKLFYASYEKDAWNTAYPGGESKRDVMSRVDSFWVSKMEPLKGREKGQTVLLSGHGAWIRLLIEKLNIPSFSEGQVIGNGDVLSFCFTERWVLERHYPVGTNVSAKI